jgi:hypothetical protein
MPADSYFAFGSKMDFKAIPAAFGDIFTEMGDMFLAGAGKVFTDALKDAADIYGNDAALALVPGSGKGSLSMVAAMKLLPGKDSRGYITKTIERVNALAAMRNIGRFVHTPNAGKMGADTYDLVKFVPAASGSTGNNARMGKFLETLPMYIASKNGVEYSAVGEGAEKRLAELLGGTNPGFIPTTAWKTIVQNYGQYSKSGVAYVSFSALIQEAVRVISQYDIGTTKVKSIAAKLRNIPAGGGVYGMSQFTQNSILGSTLITKAEVDVLFNLINAVF